MLEIILGIGVATFIVYTIFNVTYILSMRRTSDSMTSFFRNTEGNLNAALGRTEGNARKSEKDHQRRECRNGRREADIRLRSKRGKEHTGRV